MANKAELVEAVVKKTGFTKKESANAVNAVFDALQDIIASGDKSHLSVLVLSVPLNVANVLVAILKQANQ